MTTPRFAALALATALAGCGAPETLRYDASRPDALLDLYRPGGDGPLPLVVYIHGGAWRMGDRGDGEDVARRLVPEGYAVASVDYRLAPAHRWPAQLDDVLAALAYLRAQAAALGLDPARFGAFGISAGGHLAAMAALTDPGLRCAVVAAGEGDLRVHGAEPIMAEEDSILSDLLGPPPWSADALASASPCARARAGPAAVLVLHSERDGNVSSTQGRRLHAALAAAGATTKLVVTPDGLHGRAWRQPAQLEPMLAWLREHLAR